MIRKISIRLRLTIINVLLLTCCCIGLTFILNISANQMADIIEATPLTPAQTMDSATSQPAQNDFESMPPSIGTEASQSARSTFLQNSIFYMIFVVIIGGLLTYCLSGIALKPLHELSKQMKNITVHNLSENLPVPNSHDEVADLTCTFNEMSSKLDDAFSMQKRFSQSAAHELRTPLTVLKTKVDVFNKKNVHTAQEYDALLCVIAKHTNRLSDLVKNLLDLTNMDAIAHSERIALKPLLTDIADELSMLAHEKHISIAIQGGEQTVQGNQTLLHRAFYNLLENAIKYNHENGHVDIRVSTDNTQCVVTFSDTGIGIPEDLYTRIFDPFYRVDASRSRQMGGAGLGLSIVKTIVEKHHGQINVQANPSRGTIFTVTL